MNLKVLNIFSNLFGKLLPKIADGNVRQEIKAEIIRLETEFRMSIRWAVGVVIVMIFAFFFYKSITDNGFLLNIDTPIETLWVLLILGGLKVISGISFKELYKMFKDFLKKKGVNND